MTDSLPTPVDRAGGNHFTFLTELIAIGEGQISEKPDCPVFLSISISSINPGQGGAALEAISYWGSSSKLMLVLCPASAMECFLMSEDFISLVFPRVDGNNRPFFAT